MTDGRGRPDELASILLVDDRPANLFALEAILEPLGQRLVRAECGEEALWRLLDEEFALVLLDVQMPGLDGFQVASMIRERPATRHVPIIFLTALSRETAHIFRGYAEGAVDYLVKPFDANVLRAKVSIFVDLYLKGKLVERQAELLRLQEVEALERRSEHRFRSLTESIAGCVWAAHQHGEFHYANRGARQFGVAADARFDLISAVDEADQERATEVWTAALASAEPFELECRLRRRADAAPRWYLVRGSALRDMDGRRNGWIVSGTDIDDRKRAEQLLVVARTELEAAIQAKDAFLAAASHELRSPLATILTQAELALMNLGGDTEFFPGKAFALIRRQVDRMARLVADLLDVSKIKEGRLSLQLERFDFAALAAEVVERTRPTSEQHALSLVVDPSLWIEADRDRLDQVLTNLLSNAIRYAPDGGEVELTATTGGDQLRFSVRDQGLGIEADKQATIFERYERAHGGGYGGLGLGLNIARGIVEQHGGRIWVESAGRPGEGTTFHVSVPGLSPRATVAGAEEPPPDASQETSQAGAERVGRAVVAPARAESVTGIESWP